MMLRLHERLCWLYLRLIKHHELPLDPFQVHFILHKDLVRCDSNMERSTFGIQLAGVERLPQGFAVLLWAPIWQDPEWWEELQELHKQIQAINTVTSQLSSQSNTTANKVRKWQICLLLQEGILGILCSVQYCEVRKQSIFLNLTYLVAEILLTANSMVQVRTWAPWERRETRKSEHFYDPSMLSHDCFLHYRESTLPIT